MKSAPWKERVVRLFKLRFAILYPFGIWAVVSGFSTDQSIRRSIWLIVLGLAIRSWSNCYAIKMEKLTTSGPYAYVRHPLYLGSFLIMTGFLIMLNVPWTISLMCVAIVIGVVYQWTIKREEGMLLNKFGQEYVEYRKAVRSFIPRLVPFRGGQKWGMSFERYFRSQEYKLVIWMIILVIAFHLKEEFLIEGEKPDLKIILLLIMAFLLGLLDFSGELIRKKTKSVG